MADKKVTITVVADVDMGEVESLDQLIEDIKSKTVGVDVDVEDGEIDTAKEKEEGLNTTAEVDIKVDDTAVQTSMQNIQDGINQTKQGLTELGQGFGTVMESAGKQETNFTFLQNALGDADKAKAKMSEINGIVADLPGDDTALQGLLSSAAAKDASLTSDALKSMANNATDYFSAMSFYGKSASESQQDMTNYLLTGNTAELERSPILQDHIDKLKEAGSVEERNAALAQALTDEHWAGMGAADTYNNKLETFMGMLDRGKYNLGGMFQEGAKGAMDFILNLDDATNGVVGMGLALATEFGPGLFSSAQGVISMTSGLSSMAAQYGGIMPMISSFGSSIAGAGSSLLTFATGPIGIAIAAIALLAVAIYEIGKSFGWWSDVGTMFEAISAGVQRMWSAFMNNEGVIMIIDQIKGAFNNLLTFIGEIGSIIGQALGFDQMGGEFDIVRAAIDALGQVGSFVLPLISGYIDYMKAVFAALAPIVIWVLQNVIIPHFQRVYSTALAVWPVVSSIISGAVSIITGIINGAKGVFNGLMSIWHQCSSTVQSMASIISGALSAAGTAWNNFKTTVMNAVQPILDAAGQVGDAISGIGAAIGFGGIETPVVNNAGYSAGSTMVSQGNTIIFNMYGDIKDEKTLDDTIDAINNRIQFEALGNGTTTTDNGGAT